MKDSWAEGTKKLYLQVWDKYESWSYYKCIKTVLPPIRMNIIEFALDLSSTAPSQIKTFIAILGILAKVNGWKSPYKDEVLMRVFKSIERNRVKREKTAPFPLKALMFHLKNTYSPRIQWLRDALVCALCCRTTWRAETLCALNCHNLSFQKINNKTFAVFNVKKSKTNQSGDSFVYFIDPSEEHCIVKMLEEYLKLAFPNGWTERIGPIFLSDSGERMDTAGVSNIVKKITERAGFERKYSSRSLRVGAVSWMLQAGFSIENIKIFWMV